MPTKKSVTSLILGLLVASPLNPRKYFDATALDELADSIQAQNVIQNLVVRPYGDKYEVVAGGRRLRALQQLLEQGKITDKFVVPVQLREMTDSEALQVAITENANRADVHPMEQADAFAALYDLGLSPDEISVKMGVDKPVVVRQLQLSRKISDKTRALYLDDALKLAQVQALSMMSKTEQDAYIFDRKAGEAYAKEDYVSLDPDNLPEGIGWDEEYEVYVDEDGNQAEPTIREGAVKRPYYSFHTASVIRDMATENKIPLDRAIFPLENYQGEIVAGMFGAGDYFANRVLFMECQKTAVQELHKELNHAGLNVHNEKDEPTVDYFQEQAGHATLYLDPHGNFHRFDNTGPRMIEARKANAEKGSVTETVMVEKKKPANKKRIRLEDKAVNRAVENELMNSHRLALETFVMVTLGVGGSRLRLDSGFTNPHEGYHDQRALDSVAAFYALVETSAVKLSAPGSDKKGEPLRTFSWEYNDTSDKAGAARNALLYLDDSELELLVQSLITLTMTNVFDGTRTMLQNNILDTRKPTLSEFFTPDRTYLETCKNAELLTMLGEMGKSFVGKSRPENLEYIIKLPEYAQWVPPALRPGAAAAPVDENEAPFDVDEPDEDDFIPPVTTAEGLPAAA